MSNPFAFLGLNVGMHPQHPQGNMGPNMGMPGPQGNLGMPGAMSGGMGGGMGGGLGGGMGGGLGGGMSGGLGGGMSGGLGGGMSGGMGGSMSGHPHHSSVGPMPPPPQPPQMNPAMNNQPLQFNTSKNKPPMPMTAEEKEDRDKQKPFHGDFGLDDGMMGGNNNMMSGMGFAPMMGSGMGEPGMMGNMMMGPMSFNQFGGFPMGPMDNMGPPVSQKEVIHVKDCTLLPPPPGAPPPSTRERPPGCRTVFVGGLPELLTEDMLRDIFEQCGGITSVRMSKKNFAHIRFDAEECVDKALYLSGYRIQIGDNTDKPNTGRIHVDFAQARDDLYEWECKQRALAREARHRERIEEDRLRPPSPPPIIHFSDHEASALTEKLKTDDTFMKAAQVLVTWLERGDCSKRSANIFYAMIQSTNSHVRRLLNEKMLHEEEVQAMKEKFHHRMQGILRQLEQIEKVFEASAKQKAWDHFSKAQRKNLDLWRRQCQDIRSTQQNEFLKERQEDEMDLSDEDNPDTGPNAKKRKNDIIQDAHLNQLKEENDSLKCQLEAYKNEVDLMKQEGINNLAEKDKQVQALQQALQGMQQQLITAKADIKKEKEARRLSGNSSKEGEDTNTEAKSEASKSEIKQEIQSSNVTSSLDSKQARLVGLISTFLHVHPFGASVDYIWSFLQRCNITLRTSEIEDLLEGLPSVFKQDMRGIGASIEKRWSFIGFNSETT